MRNVNQNAILAYPEAEFSLISGAGILGVKFQKTGDRRLHMQKVTIR